MYLKEDVGTTVYLSPEQVNRVGLYDYKIDIWAIG
jgi:serine/threonine protein kinase